jgi:hypothetical protein
VTTAGRERGAARRAGALLALVLGLAGCGGGHAATGVTLTLTGDFGTRPIVQLQAPSPGSRATALGLLRAHARVAGGTGPGAAWFAYVNGEARSTAAAGSTALRDGDRVWWDRHARDAAAGVRTVVGAFPEPFLHGLGHKRLPVRVECSDPEGAPCRTVADGLVAAGVPAARGILTGSRLQDTLRVLVGPWDAVRADEALAQLERGPRVSGVYARPAGDGRSIVALDAGGAPAGVYGAGTGLVAATRVRDEPPVWAVTGTDAAGVAAAARAFDESTLGHRFAILVSADLPLSLPRPAR